jgi:FkbM family methyltransferase
VIRRLVQRAAGAFGYKIVRTGAHAQPQAAPKLRSDEMAEAWRKQLLKQGPVRTVFDVGANRGQTIAWMRPLFPDAVYHSFEPNPVPHGVLAGWAATQTGVHAHRLALGDAPGEAVLHGHTHDTTDSLLADSSKIGVYAPAKLITPKGETRVQVERMDAFCARQGITHIDILKIDAQGYEGKILEGAGDMLQPSRVRSLLLEILFVEYYQQQAWGDDLLKLLRERGYKLYGLNHVDFDADQGWRWADAMFLPT